MFRFHATLLPDQEILKQGCPALSQHLSGRRVGNRNAAYKASAQPHRPRGVLRPVKAADIDIHMHGLRPSSCMLYTHKHTHSHTSTPVCGYMYTHVDTQVLIYHTGICIHEQAQALLLPAAYMSSRLAWAMLNTQRLAQLSLLSLGPFAVSIGRLYRCKPPLTQEPLREPAPLNLTTLLYDFVARAIRNAQVPPKTRGLQREAQHLTHLREGPLLWEVCPFQGLS